jgi:hypothetical protein
MKLHPFAPLLLEPPLGVQVVVPPEDDALELLEPPELELPPDDAPELLDPVSMPESSSPPTVAFPPQARTASPTAHVSPNTPTDLCTGLV